ncbi:MAG TPA: class I SAM-dependent methyltransferase [Bryobacteraceae bacterium]|nr:class I SAM-dependent methyltransferase [Bryobacteraceae bacterium]
MRNDTNPGSQPKPSPADLAFIESIVAACAARRTARPLRALLLGVTPEIAGMRWPRGAMLRAADRRLSSIHTRWPGDVPRRRAALCADWRALPLRRSSCDVVIGDHCFVCADRPDDFRGLAAEAHRVLRPDGLFVARSCLPPRTQKEIETLMAEQRSLLSEFFHETPLSAPPQTVREGCPIFVAAPRGRQEQRNAPGGAASAALGDAVMLQLSERSPLNRR